ncbi:hypothetical protein [Aureimonas glaciei]|uniref:hypothetical protein n=1 Tax=Aureimonas glaciei TaxID=1776957 RepID=UPI00166BF533|nr:hypothetical protein [Aureimonas glaciei]
MNGDYRLGFPPVRANGPISIPAGRWAIGFGAMSLRLRAVERTGCVFINLVSFGVHQ